MTLLSPVERETGDIELRCAADPSWPVSGSSAHAVDVQPGTGPSRTALDIADDTFVVVPATATVAEWCATPPAWARLVAGPRLTVTEDRG